MLPFYTFEVKNAIFPILFSDPVTNHQTPDINQSNPSIHSILFSNNPRDRANGDRSIFK